MLTPKDAAEILRHKYPDRTVTGMADYKPNLYLLEATVNPDKEANTSLFTVDKISGKVSPIAIGTDLIGISKASATKSIEPSKWTT